MEPQDEHHVNPLNGPQEAPADSTVQAETHARPLFVRPLRILFILILILAGTLVASAAGVYLYLSVGASKGFAGGASEPKVFFVEQGERARDIALKLQREHLISRDYFFLFYVWREHLSGALQAGNYAIPPDMSPAQIADMMAGGQVLEDTITVTIPEGFTAMEAEQRMRDAGLFSGDPTSFSDLTVGDFPAHDFLIDLPRGASLEGYLFPDTYEFARDASPASVAGRMLDNFGKKLKTLTERTDVSDVVVMASMLQREVASLEDMKLVSGIFWKRLDLGMPLQVDATVIYATGRKNVTTTDLAVDSLYNTYRYAGLPIGPISNPGSDALEAALNPEASDYLFYLSKPDGETVFSKTLTEHNIAKAKYLR